ncbi:hypothetical protein CF326_g906 [Tilletia indica]|nr:hypothetical protein CF326_g906 [Tilletia indica]
MTIPARGTVKAVVFDLDGLLLDTETIYTEIIRRKLAQHGKDFTWDIKAKMMGKPESEARRVLLQQIWPDPSALNGIHSSCPFPLLETQEEQEDQETIQALISTKPLPGALRLVRHLAKHNVPMAIASGSTGGPLLLKRMKNSALFDPFGKRLIMGDDPRLSRDKPNPDTFLLAAHTLLGSSATGEDVEGATDELTLADNIRSWGAEHDEGGLKGGEEHVLVFEDGIFGVKAGIAAGMKVIWVPDSNLKKISPPGQELGADQVLDSLEAFVPEEWGLPPFEGDD